MAALSSMAMVITATWGLLLGEAYLFFEIIRPLAPNIHESVTSATLKVAAVAFLFVVWMAAMFLFERYYVRVTRGPEQ